MKKDMLVEDSSKTVEQALEERLNFYRIMERIMGEQRQLRQILERPPGLPTPPSSPEEIKIKKIFDSCAFKTSMSCVLGENHCDY